MRHPRRSLLAAFVLVSSTQLVGCLGESEATQSPDPQSTVSPLGDQSSSMAQSVSATAITTAAAGPAPSTFDKTVSPSAAVASNAKAPLPIARPSPIDVQNLPIRTWIARRYTTPNAPAAGISGVGGGSKHVRIAQNPDNGRLYFLGGDYSSNPGDGSFVNGVWSYDLPSDRWTMDYPYCGRRGEIYAARPDEVGWVWDSRRKKFWALPGFFGVNQSGSGVCGAGPLVGTPVAKILTFDPAVNAWTDPGAALEPVPPGTELSKFAVYDPQTDSIWRVRYEGGRGTVWTVYFISENRWEEFSAPAEDQTYINSAHLDKEYLALDPIGRHIYVIDPNGYRLFRLDMATRRVRVLAAPPDFPSRPATLQDLTVIVWNSVNNVLHFLRFPNSGSGISLATYRPDQDRWEIDRMYQPEGLTVRGNAAVFDASNNALFVMGGLGPTGDVDEKVVTHYFVYRYDARTAPVAASGLATRESLPSAIATQPLTAQPLSTGVWQPLPPDPAGYGYGFARGHWASRVNKAILFFGNSHNPLGNNSIRAFDPATRTWEYLWANNPASGLQNRDNFSSFLVPTMGAAGELWVAGGSGLESYQARTGLPALRAGRFDIASRTWVAVSTDNTSAWSGVVAGSVRNLPNPAMAWCDALDMGMSFGGAVEGNASDYQYIIERNLNGPQPYRAIEFTGPRPPPRTQATNLGVCDDNAFYVYGGLYQVAPSPGDDGYRVRNDLWRFDLRQRKWQELPPGGRPAMYQSVTFDRVKNAIVVFGGPTGSAAWAFFLDSQRWENITPQNAPENYNGTGIYAPNVNMHLYFGGAIKNVSSHLSGGFQLK